MSTERPLRRCYSDTTIDYYRSRCSDYFVLDMDSRPDCSAGLFYPMEIHFATVVMYLFFSGFPITVPAHPSGPAIKRTSRISPARRTSAAATSLSASAAAASFNSIAIAEERMNASCASAHHHNHFITITEVTSIVADFIARSKARRSRPSSRWRLGPDSARRRPLRHGPSPPSSIECQAWCPASQDPSST